MRLCALLLLMLAPGVDAGGEEIFSEFDGTSPNGVWERLNPIANVFDFDVTPTHLEMFNGPGSVNQHVVRQGVEIDPTRAYAIECDFEIHGVSGITSFALHLNVAPDDFGSSDAVDTWTVNMDLFGPVMRWMGFVGGVFSEIPGAQSLPWASSDVEYHVLVKVNENLAGESAPQTVSVTWSQAGLVQAAFERDYMTHAYAPDYSRPVRIGVNSHGAHWTLRNLQVYYLDERPQAPVLAPGALALLCLLLAAALYRARSSSFSGSSQ